MRIALPLTTADRFSPHYGGSAKFVVVEVDRARRVVRRRVTVVPGASAPCQWPRLLRASGTDLLLAGRIGDGARQGMAAAGIDVLAGVPESEPEQLIAAWLAGTLVSHETACDRRAPRRGPNSRPGHGAGDAS
jgi:predicted Fe-Mo cluster-binding NifX family protein